MTEKLLKFAKNSNKSNFYRVLGPRVARFRQDKGLSPAFVAQSLGITEEIYNGLERGDLKMPQEALFKLERLLEVSHFEMIAGRSESEVQATAMQVSEDIETLAMYQQMSNRKREAWKPKVREIIARSAPLDGARELEAELLGKK
jgi:transcriptional regulator with XRE-family HTH domain